jgi:hypothetical protein
MRILLVSTTSQYSSMFTCLSVQCMAHTNVVASAYPHFHCSNLNLDCLGGLPCAVIPHLQMHLEEMHMGGL